MNCDFGCIGTGSILLTKGTGAGRIGIGMHVLEFGSLRVAVPVVFNGNTKLNGTGNWTCGRDGGSCMASGNGVLDVSAAWVG